VTNYEEIQTINCRNLIENFKDLQNDECDPEYYDDNCEKYALLQTLITGDEICPNITSFKVQGNGILLRQ